jgi:hypothetical protein
MNTLAWSWGTSRYDVHPRQLEGTLRDFALHVLRHRAPDKERSGYVAGPLEGDGRRCAKNAAPRCWLALDVDGVDAAVHMQWRLFACGRFRGVGWPTASSSQEVPRERLIVLLDEVLTPRQALDVGRVLITELRVRFAGAVYVDESTLRASQPCFLPLVGAQPFYLLGDELNTAELLSQVPPPRSPRRPAAAAEADVAGARFNWVVESFERLGVLGAPLGLGKGYAVTCPWRHCHTGTSVASATALLAPSIENGHRGAFRCLHAHCASRGLGDVVTLLQAQALAT